MAFLVGLLGAAAGSASGSFIGGTVGAAVTAGIGAVVALAANRLTARADRKSREATELQVTLRRSTFELATRDDPLPEPAGPIEILRPDRAVVPFIGREEELALIKRWIESKNESPVLLLTGPGGIGKTRLALHVANIYPQNNYDCRIIREGRESEVGGYLQRKTSLDRPLLLIVDYADARPDLSYLLDDISASARRVRAILIARSSGEWWRRLKLGSSRVRAMLSRTEALELPPGLRGQEDRSEKIIDTALEAMARELSLEIPEVSVSVGQERPTLLVLHMAALVALLRGTIDRPEPQSNKVAADRGVFSELLEHEIAYWKRAAKGLDFDIPFLAVRRSFAVAFLLRPRSEEETARALQRVPDLEMSTVASRRQVARWIRQLYPASQPLWVGNLEPDLLAEHFVTEELAGSDELVVRCFEELPGLQAEAAISLLARACGHHPEAPDILAVVLKKYLTSVDESAIAMVASSEGVLGGTFASVLADSPTSLAQLVQIAEAIPYPTAALAQAHQTIVQRIVDMLPLSENAGMARWKQLLGQLNAQAGNLDSGVREAEEAVAIYRELEASQPEPGKAPASGVSG